VNKYQFVSEKQYLHLEPPTTGSVRTSIWPPKNWTQKEDLHYCKSQVPPRHRTHENVNETIDCVWIDRYRTPFPEGEEKTCFMTVLYFQSKKVTDSF
jgi:hypothetical protein